MTRRKLSFFEEIEELVLDVAHMYMFVPAPEQVMYTQPASIYLLKVNN